MKFLISCLLIIQKIHTKFGKDINARRTTDSLRRQPPIHSNGSSWYLKWPKLICISLFKIIFESILDRFWTCQSVCQSLILKAKLIRAGYGTRIGRSKLNYNSFKQVLSNLRKINNSFSVYMDLCKVFPHDYFKKAQTKENTACKIGGGQGLL